MKVAVLGSGSWGTALAQVLSDNGNDVIVWGRSEVEINDISTHHKNSTYFNDIRLNSSIKGTLDFLDIIDSEMLVIAVPSQAVREVINKINSEFKHEIIIVNVAKGFDSETLLTPIPLIKELMAPTILRGVVSLIGPSHAEEVVIRQHTAITAVSDNQEVAEIVQKAFSNEYFRVYTNNDIIGAEIGAALKNVIALASGMISGIGLGDNARAALITRGLAEIKRLGLALGGEESTFNGLTGLGDLIVTCSSVHSRNYQAGYQIGSHNSGEHFMQNNTKTVEGINAAKFAYQLKDKLHITMPITEEIYRIVYMNAKPSESIRNLMLRDLKSE